MKLTAYAIFVLIFVVTMLNAQTNNDLVKQQLDRIYKEKIKVTTEDIRHYLQNGIDIEKQSGNNTKYKIQAEDENIVISSRNEPESEISVAINPTNPDNMIASPILTSMSNYPAILSCPIYYTEDGGDSWHQSDFVTFPVETNAITQGGGDPVLIFDSEGKAYITWIQVYITLDENQQMDMVYEALFWAWSDDGGKTWNQEGNSIVGDCQAESPDGGFTEFYDKQWIATDQSDGPYKNNLYVCYTKIAMFGNEGASKIMMLVKKPGADSFEKNEILVSGEFQMTQFSFIDVDNDGNVHITFYGADLYGCGLYHTMSTDGGNNWSDLVKISAYTGTCQANKLTETEAKGLNAERLYPCPVMFIDKSGTDTDDNLYITWTADGINSNGETGLDIYFSKSTDSGISWSEPKIINNQRDNNVHDFYSSITVNPDGVVIISWYDRRDDIENLNTDYYITMSFDGGNTFLTEKKISSQPADFGVIGNVNGDFGVGEYNQLVATAEYAYPVWADGRRGNGIIDMYMAKVKINEDDFAVEEITPVNNRKLIENIYPNPASGKLNISIFEGYPEIMIDIVSIDGRSMYKGSLNADITFKLDAWSSGRYIIMARAQEHYQVMFFEIVK